MKRLLMVTCVALMAMWSVGAMADDIGVVNMKRIFQSSAQVKAINTMMKGEFAARKADIIKRGRALQAEVQKYQKNQSVMNKRNLAALQRKISKESVVLRKTQGKFRQDLLLEQNKKMSAFLKKVKSVVKKVAEKKGLDVVFPANAVLYSKNKLDITTLVISELK